MARVFVRRPYPDYGVDEVPDTVKASEYQVGSDHYKNMVIQPSEFIHKNGLGFLEGNVVKYICRHRAKGGREDLEKAKHYIELLLEWDY